MASPSQRREMVGHAVPASIASIDHACSTFKAGRTCYRCQAKACQEDAIIAECWLRLTNAYRDWGFALGFPRLRNVRGFAWNHKRSYRIYRELEQNLRIWPCRRAGALGGVRGGKTGLVGGYRARPEGRWAKPFVLNVMDDFNRQGLAMEEGISLPAARHPQLGAHSMERNVVRHTLRQPARIRRDPHAQRHRR
jgi:putative transposase